MEYRFESKHQNENDANNANLAERPENVNEDRQNESVHKIGSLVT